MKGWPAILVVAAVAIAVVVSIWTFATSRTPSREYELRAMEKSVDKLRAEVRELRAAVRELREAPASRAARKEVAPETGTAAVDPQAVGLETGEVNVEAIDIELAVDAAGTYTIDGREVARDELQAELRRTLRANPAMRLVVNADETVPMVEVNGVLEDARAVGIHRTSLSGRASGDPAGAE